MSHLRLTTSDGPAPGEPPLPGALKFASFGQSEKSTACYRNYSNRG